MCDEDCKQGVRVQGTFLGQPIDLTVREYDIPPPEETAAPEAPVDAPDGAVVTDEPTTPADPAPEAVPVSDEPKNPAGNAEQV